LLLNPRYRGRAITLTFDQFKYGWTNALDEDEAKDLYDTYHVTGSGIALAQMADANLNPWTESKVDTKNPDRGRLLILDGEKDHGSLGDRQRLLQAAEATSSSGSFRPSRAKASICRRNFSAGGTPTDELHVLVCIGVVDVDALETGVIDQPANSTGRFR
jgi:hypothetical protein